ncbi:hypothetical protein IBX73_08170, partial [candidate division WOR-3 bacterium]|nr:hypothetical protein [candidate division WOR-3 bacterium]
VWLNNTQVNFQWTPAARLLGPAGGTWEAVVDKSEKEPAPDAPIRYIIQIDTATSFASPFVIDTVATTSTAITLPQNGFCWRVRAYDLAGNQGAYTPADSFGVDVTPPPAPVLIAPADGACLNNNAVDLIWHAAVDNLSGTDHYVLQYALNDAFTLGLVETTLVDTTFSITIPDTVYYWRVRGVDAATNESGFSTVRYFEVDTDIPAAPVLNAPLDGVYLGDTLVTYEWSTVSASLLIASGLESINGGAGREMHAFSSPICYVIQVDTVLDFTAPLVTDTLDTNTATLNHGEGFYYWRVRAYDLAGNEGPYSGPDSFGVDITVPVIESTSVWNDTSAVGPFEIRTMVIDDLAGVDSVILFYKRSEDPYWIAAAMLPAGTPNWYVDSIPPVAIPYDTVRYYIEAADAAQPGNVATDPAGAPTDHYSFVANCTGVAELSTLPHVFALEIMGNPAMNRLRLLVSLPQTAMISLRLYDCAGRIIGTPIKRALPAGIHELQGHADLSAGIYFYVLDTPWRRHVGKVTVVR